jgi:hypothetical protein
LVDRLGGGRDPLKPREIKSLPDAALAERAMRRVGDQFVAVERSNGSGVDFFDHPLPYSNWLCRVNRYWVPDTILAGKISQPQDRWSDPVTVERFFGI